MTQEALESAKKIAESLQWKKDKLERVDKKLSVEDFHDKRISYMLDGMYIDSDIAHTMYFLIKVKLETEIVSLEKELEAL
jgi:hypothetical protein